jgi:hypothetical protein
MKLLTAVAAIPFLLALGSAADAACVYPQAPQSLPNGTSATKEEMLAAQAVIKEYTRAVQGPPVPKPDASPEELTKFNTERQASYLACLEQERNDAVAKLDPADPELAQKTASVEAIFAKKNNAAVDELTAVATRWSEEVKAFSAKSAK